MSLTNRMNAIMEYTEIHLKEEINSEVIARIAGCSYNDFLRLFSLLNNMTYQEYIRSRKMSQAAVEIIHTNRKIIDIAIEYGYDNGDTFAVAFKKQFGCSPSFARKEEKTLTLFHPRSYHLTISGNEKMDYKIIKKQKMVMSGYSVYSDDELNKAPAFWNEIKQKGILQETFLKANTEISYGLCFGYDHQASNRYMIAVEGELDGPYETFEIAETNWMVFEGKGPLSEILNRMWKQIYTEVLPSSQYGKNTSIPTIEKYYGVDNDNQDYMIEIWIPVIKK